MRAGFVIFTVFWVLVFSSGPAMADAPGPTDYQTEVVSITPPDAPISVRIIGGDSFIEVTQTADVEIEVLGYQGEPYIRFDADGTVVENRRSPTFWQNLERYGDAFVPSSVDASLPPQWRRATQTKRWSWHDHRAHWMNKQPPLGVQPGDQVLDSTIPLIIDGRAASIRVESFYLPRPPIWGAIAGLLTGLAVGVGLWRLKRKDSLLTAAIMAAVSVLGLAFGAAAFFAVPAETEPSVLLMLLPGLALLMVGGYVFNYYRAETSVYLDGLALSSAAMLIFWAWTRSSGLYRSLIPTLAPQNLDRVVICLVAVTGIFAALTGVVGLLKPRLLNEMSVQKHESEIAASQEQDFS